MAGSLAWVFMTCVMRSAPPAAITCFALSGLRNVTAAITAQPAWHTDLTDCGSKEHCHKKKQNKIL